jgi:hypothetical protein
VDERIGPLEVPTISDISASNSWRRATAATQCRRRSTQVVAALVATTLSTLAGFELPSPDPAQPR